MRIDCGSQVILCDLPIRIDTYNGCTHDCKYCFAQKKKYDLTNVEPVNCSKSLVDFINGKRTSTTNWCDWDIPLHWGGLSDPFQPVEAKYGISYELLKIFAETKYPFVVSTKGKLLATEKYLNILKECNAVVQISMVCGLYDKIELGAPTFEERIEMCRKIAPNCKRLIVRMQPYITEAFDEVIKNIPRLKEAGVYGVVLEGMKFFKKKDGLIKIGGDFCYKKEVLESDFARIKDVCHKNGLKFYCGENRLRTMGDAWCCCGIDGLEGFRGNDYNLCHLYNNDPVKPTETMRQPKTAKCFKALYQDTVSTYRLRTSSFNDEMIAYIKNKGESCEKIFGKHSNKRN